jgi:hypothetical protein
VGPNGDILGEIERITYPGRSKNKIFSNKPFGVLIGAIKTKKSKDNLPNESNSEMFVIGEEKEFYDPEVQGELWFNINDALVPEFIEFRIFFI